MSRYFIKKLFIIYNIKYVFIEEKITNFIADIAEQYGHIWAWQNGPDPSGQPV